MYLVVYSSPNTRSYLESARGSTFLFQDIEPASIPLCSTSRTDLLHGKLLKDQLIGVGLLAALFATIQ